MPNNWDIISDVLELEGAEINQEEQFFVCPECEEKIYKEDWPNKAYLDDIDNSLICPCCKAILIDSSIL